MINPIVETRSFEPEDLGSFDGGLFEKKLLARSGERAFLEGVWAGIASTIRVGGTIEAIFGCSYQGDSAIVWLLLTNHAREKYPVLLTKAVRRYLWQLKERGIKVVHVQVDEQHHAARKWAERLGFEKINGTHYRKVL